MAGRKLFITFCFFLCFGQLINSEKPPNTEDPSDNVEDTSIKADLTPSFAPGTFVHRTGEDASPVINKGDLGQEESTDAGKHAKGSSANRDDLTQQPPLSADDLPKDQLDQKPANADSLEKKPGDTEATNDNSAQGYFSQVLSNLAAPLFEGDEQDFLEEESNGPGMAGTEDQRADIVSHERESDKNEETLNDLVGEVNEPVTSHTEMTTEAPDEESADQGTEDPDSDNDQDTLRGETERVSTDNQGKQSKKTNTERSTTRESGHKDEGLSKGSIESEEEVIASEDGGSHIQERETQGGTLKGGPKAVEAAMKDQLVDEMTRTSGRDNAPDRSHDEEKLPQVGSEYQEHRLSDEDVEHLRVKKNKVTELEEEMRNQPLKEGTRNDKDEKSEITMEGEQETKEWNFARLGDDSKGNPSEGVETQKREQSPEIRTTEDEKRRRLKDLQRRLENLKQEKERIVEQERAKLEEEREKDKEANKRREAEAVKQEMARARMEETKRGLDEMKTERENIRGMKETLRREKMGEEGALQGEKRKMENRRDLEDTKEDETTGKWPMRQVKNDQLRRDREELSTVTAEGPNSINKKTSNGDQVKLEMRMEDRAEVLPEKDALVDETRTVEKQEGDKDFEREEMKMKGEVDKRLAEEQELKRRLELLNEERRNFEKLAKEYRMGKSSRQKMKQTKENVEAQTSKETRGQASPRRENEKQTIKEIEGSAQDSKQVQNQEMFRELLKVIPKNELHKYRAVCQMVEVSQRSSCGAAFTQKECHEEGCCFDNSIQGAVTCFFAPSPPVDDTQEVEEKEVVDKSKHPNTAISSDSTLKHFVSKTVQSSVHSVPEDNRQFQVHPGSSHLKPPSLLKTNVIQEGEGVKTSNGMPGATHKAPGNVEPIHSEASPETIRQTSQEGAYKETSTQSATVGEEMQRNFNTTEQKPVETQTTQDANVEHLKHKDLNKGEGDIKATYLENENNDVSSTASYVSPEKSSCAKGYCDSKPDLASLVSRFKQVEKQMNKVKLGETLFEHSERNASQVNETTAYAEFLRSFRGFHETSARALLSYWPVVRNMTSDLLGCIGLDGIFDQVCNDLADVHPAVLFSTFLFGTIGVFYFLWSLTIGRMKQSAHGPNPRDVLNSYEARVRILEEEVQSLEMDKLRLQAERNDATKKKVVLEDELKGTMEKIEKTVKMIKKLEDEKQRLITAVEELRVSVQEKVTEINDKGEEIERFQAMVSELEHKVENREDEIRKLNEDLQQKIEEKEAETRHVKTLDEKIMQSMSENEKLEESLKEAKEKYIAIQGDFDDQLLHVNELQQQYEFKCNEVEVLKDCLKQIKHTKADDSEETEVDAEEMQKRLQDLMDTAKAKADLTKVEESNRKMADELDEYRRTVKELNESVEVMKEDLQMAKSKAQEATLLQREKEIELEALQKYFKATEVDLHRKLNAEEAARISSESQLQSERAKQSTAAEDADNYRQLYLKLVKETEEINKERKLQLLDADQRAHDNFISYRKTLRDLETLKDECDMLRKRLYEAEMWKSRPSSSASSTFNHVDGRSSSPARGSPSSVPVVSASPLHFVQQMMPSNPPPPPPPPSAPPSMYNSRPLPHPAELLGMAQPPPPPPPHAHPDTRGYTTPPPTTGPPPTQPPKDKRPSIQDPRDRPPHPTPPPVSGPPPPTSYGAPLPGMVRMYHPSAVRSPGPPLPNAQYSPMFMPRPAGPNPPPPPLSSGTRPKATSTPNRS